MYEVQNKIKFRKFIGTISLKKWKATIDVGFALFQKTV
jgi:hypothetical protein